MPIPKTEKIWHNGKFIPWDDAKIHVLSHVVSYGSARLRRHPLLRNSARPGDLPPARTHAAPAEFRPHLSHGGSPYSLDDLCNASLELVRVNKIGACYIRPIVLRGYGEIGVDPLGCPIEVYMACWDWGNISARKPCAKAWTSASAPGIAPRPIRCRKWPSAAANYMNSQLIRMEASANGYDEGIALDTNGYVSEGSGENIFIVRDGTVITPPLANSALPGITRNSIMTICKDLGIPVVDANRACSLRGRPG